MNWIDLVIVLILIVFIYSGVRRGFIGDFITLIGFVLSALLSFTLYAWLGQAIVERFNMTPGISNLVAFFIIFLILQIIYTIISWLILKKIQIWEMRQPRLQLYDQIFGSLPGLFNGTIIVTLILMILVISPLPPNFKSQLNNSYLSPILVDKASFLNSKLEGLFNPAANETAKQIRNLTQVLLPEKENELSFPEDLTLSVDREAENRMLELINAERAKAGVGSLEMDEKLQEVARAHCLEMFKLSYFDHNSPKTGSPFDRLDAAGINYLTAGENIALAPGVDVAHYGLMNSPSHKKNILEKNFGKVGIGVISGGIYGEMFAQEFTD